MSDRKRSILDAAERMNYFGQANPNLVTELPFTVELFAANQTNINRLHEAGIASASAGSAGMSGTRSKAARAREIVEDLRRVARTARRIEAGNKNFRNTFTLPNGGLNYQEIVERADSFAAAAPDYKEDFDKYALTAQFFADLKTDVDGLREASHEQADAKRTSVGATADTEAIIEDTLDTRKHLDTALQNHFRANPPKLAEWLTASRIERRQRTPEVSPDETPSA